MTILYKLIDHTFFSSYLQQN